MARREYDAHGLVYDTFSDSVAGLDEALTVIRRLWTETAGALLRIVAKHADVWNIPGGDLADAVQRGARPRGGRPLGRRRAVVPSR